MLALEISLCQRSTLIPKSTSLEYLAWEATSEHLNCAYFSPANDDLHLSVDLSLWPHGLNGFRRSRFFFPLSSLFGRVSKIAFARSFDFASSKRRSILEKCRRKRERERERGREGDREVRKMTISILRCQLMTRIKKGRKKERKYSTKRLLKIVNTIRIAMRTCILYLIINCDWFIFLKLPGISQYCNCNT